MAEAACPEAPPPAALKTYEEHVGAPMEHIFWRNFDAKPLVFTPQGAPREPRPAALREWYRFKDFDSRDPFADFGRAVVLLDTMVWPTHHRGRSEAPDYIAPSLDLTVWFHEPACSADWLMFDGAADVAREGLIHGHARIWTEDGRRVASGGSNLLYTPRR